MAGLEALRELRKEWPRIWWPVVVAAVVSAAVGFGAATFWWSGTVATLRERIVLLQENRTSGYRRIVEVTRGPSYRVQPDDDVVQVNIEDGSPVTIFLPTGFAKGKMVTIKDKKGNSVEVPITIMSDGGTIDGLRQLVLRGNRGSFSVIWDGVGWSLN
jgi:hypothetical protein